MISALANLIHGWQPSIRNAVLVPHVSRKIICPFNPIGSNTPTPFNRTIHTVTKVDCSVVPVEGLPCLEFFMPRAIRSLASKSAGGASVRTTVGVIGKCYYHTVSNIRVLSKGGLLTCCPNTCGIDRRSSGESDGNSFGGLRRRWEWQGYYLGFFRLPNWVDCA